LADISRTWRSARPAPTIAIGRPWRLIAWKGNPDRGQLVDQEQCARSGDLGDLADLTQQGR
jgi:hypothetical protein